MMRFEKGDPERLEGKAIIYTHNTGGTRMNPINPDYPSIWVASNAEDMVWLLGKFSDIPDEMKEDFFRRQSMMLQGAKESVGEISTALNENKDYILARLKQSDLPPEEIAEMAEKMEESIRRSDYAPKRPVIEISMPFPIFEPGIIEGYMDGFDVVRTSDMPNMEYAGRMLNATSTLYVVEYLSQVESGMEVREGYETRVKGFQEMDGSEFKTTLGKLMHELMGVLATGGETGQIFADLKHMASGSPFIRDVVNMFQISTTESPGKERILVLYYNKICAALDEDFEGASRLKSEIDRLGI